MSIAEIRHQHLGEGPKPNVQLLDALVVVLHVPSHPAFVVLHIFGCHHGVCVDRANVVVKFPERSRGEKLVFLDVVGHSAGGGQLLSPLNALAHAADEILRRGRRHVRNGIGDKRGRKAQRHGESDRRVLLTLNQNHCSENKAKVSKERVRKVLNGDEVLELREASGTLDASW